MASIITDDLTSIVIDDDVVIDDVSSIMPLFHEESIMEKIITRNELGAYSDLHEEQELDDLYDRE